MRSTDLLALRRTEQLPVLISVAGERASLRFLEFFTANNPHIRRAYARAVNEFLS